MPELQREGVVVRPLGRLSQTQVKLIDGVSRDLLEDPGLLCYNATAADIYRSAGARVESEESWVRVRLSSSIIDEALDSAPSKVVLGARDPSNRLVIDAHEPRVRFGSGSETNVWLDVKFEGTAPQFARLPGSVERLCNSAHLCENLDNLDFFIRNVNIRNKEIHLYLGY